MKTYPRERSNLVHGLLTPRFILRRICPLTNRYYFRLDDCEVDTTPFMLQDHLLGVYFVIAVAVPQEDSLGFLFVSPLMCSHLSQSACVLA